MELDGGGNLVWLQIAQHLVSGEKQFFRVY